jgi:hypothetical protein
MPEVGGDACLYVDPFDIDAITEGLLRLASDSALSDELRQKGLANAKRFQTDEPARALQDLLWQT